MFTAYIAYTGVYACVYVSPRVFSTRNISEIKKFTFTDKCVSIKKNVQVQKKNDRCLYIF